MRKRKRPTTADKGVALDELDRLLSAPTIPLLLAGKIMGLGRSLTYAAAKSGDLPTIRFGGKIVCPTPPLRQMLGLTAQQSASSPAPITA